MRRLKLENAIGTESAWSLSLMGGAGGGGAHFGLRIYGHGRGRMRAYLARRRAKLQLLQATEAELNERGLPIPPRPMSQERIFTAGFACGLFLGLFIGLVFWELT